MKTLWEEYGLVIIAIVVVAALITLALVLSTQTSDNIDNNVSKFEDVGGQAIDGALDMEEESTTK